MTDLHTKPIIFLAFANDRQQSSAYLRNLGREADRLRTSLQQAAALCDVVERHSVTPAQILQVFHQYKDRIAIFHYAGHAQDYTLLLEDSQGNQHLADGQGLAGFLRQQRGLQLVFLNACSTRAQADQLRDAGVPLVIATARAIPDELAAGFADAFYQSLASGDTLESAFANAKGAVQFSQGDLNRHLAAVPDPAADHIAQGLPWEIYVLQGAEDALQWNLPDAAGDPLFGLPALPKTDLPPSPFRNILWFRREDAPIFFGRGYEIRTLYQRVTAANGAPIVLFYGQSGVGKSSLLAAGLLPRLGQVQTVLYARRDQQKGLLGTLLASLPEQPTIRKDADNLLDYWHTFEIETGRPLTFILDQVEEVYTRPAESMRAEVDACLAVLVNVFGDPATRPQGRLILGFRKEWLAEAEKLFTEYQLPHSKLFLQRLDRRGIVEAIQGPARTKLLQEHFGLQVEPTLAGEIADDLLADSVSAIAPTLQILLDKMWQQAKARNFDQPTFDRELYHQLRRQGLLLDNFLDQQVASLHQELPAAVASGLALDLLAFHTTPLGTAEQRTHSELAQTYAHQLATIEPLLLACRDRYLLVDSLENQPNVEPTTRLAHDTLAPLIRQRFEESDKPGQRALRILQNRAVDWADDTTNPAERTPLDRQDLRLVERGVDGMRVWNEAEQRLIVVSRNARTRRRGVERWLLIGAIAAGIFIAIFAGVAWWQWSIADDATAAAQIETANARIARDAEAAAKAEAEIEAINARKAEATAEAEAGRAQQAQTEAEREAAIAYSRQLASHSTSELSNNQYEAALLLGIEAGLATAALEIGTFEAFAAIRSALEQPVHTFKTLYTDAAGVYQPIWSRDESRIIAIGNDNTVRIWDANTGTELLKLAGHTWPIYKVVWSADESKILTSSRYDLDTSVRIWDANTGTELLQLVGHTRQINQVVWSADESKILTGSDDGTVRIWDANDGNELGKLVGHTGPVTDATWNADESKILTGSDDGTVRIWDASSRQVLINLGDYVDHINHAIWTNDKKKILTLSDGRAHIWSTTTGAELVSLVGDTKSIYQATWSADESRILTIGRDDTVRIWDTNSGLELVKMEGHRRSIRQATWSQDESKILTSSDDTTIRIWDANTGEELVRLPGHINSADYASWNRDGRKILTNSEDGTARIWDANTGEELVRLSGHAGPVTKAIWNRDESKVLTSSSDGTIRISNVNVNSEPELVKLSGHDGAVTKAIWNRDGSKILTIDYGNTARIWDLSTGVELMKLTEPVDDAIWNSDESKILTRNGSTARIWDARSGVELFRLTGHVGQVNQVAWSADESKILTSGYDNTVRVWDAHKGHEIFKLESAGSAFWSKDESKILTIGEDNIVQIWDASTGLELGKLVGHTGSVNEATWSTDETKILTISEDNTLRFWDASNGLETLKLEDVNMAAWSKDKSKIFISSRNGNARILDVSTGLEVVTLTGNIGSIYRVAWSPYKSKLLAILSDNTMGIWDTRSGIQLSNLIGHTSQIMQMTWSADESKILTSGYDNTVRVWDSNSGAELFTLTGHVGQANQAAWNANESKIFTFSDGSIFPFSGGGIVRIWYTQMSDLIAAACTRAPRNLTQLEWNRITDGQYHPTCAEAPIPPDAIDAITNEARELAQNGDLPAAAERLGQLVYWLQKSGQFNTFGVERSEWLAMLQIGKSPWR